LSGLLNRRGFIQAAKLFLARQAQLGAPVSVLMFDLDHFKMINDRFGHAVGDEALRTFAATVGSNLRTSDLIARLGGEEFAVMLAGSLTDAMRAAERVRIAFVQSGTLIGGRMLAATVSVGAASGLPGTSLPELLANADAALYRAKANGRNRVEGIEAPLSLPIAGAATAAHSAGAMSDAAVRGLGLVPS
jgi:diguanylate cyclase (GGDEF)-like protein